MLSVHVGHVLVKIIYSSNSSHFLGKFGELILSNLELGIHPPRAPSFAFPVLGIFTENATGSGMTEQIHLFRRGSLMEATQRVRFGQHVCQLKAH